MDIPARVKLLHPGFGNGESFWLNFCYRLHLTGCDGWPSIEHEDVMLSREEGVGKSVAFLKAAAPADTAYKPRDV